MTLFKLILLNPAIYQNDASLLTIDRVELTVISGQFLCRNVIHPMIFKIVISCFFNNLNLRVFMHICCKAQIESPLSNKTATTLAEQ